MMLVRLLIAVTSARVVYRQALLMGVAQACKAAIA
jgi:hypothetical protein